jgi:hypothetical protein
MQKEDEMLYEFTLIMDVTEEDPDNVMERIAQLFCEDEEDWEDCKVIALSAIPLPEGMKE